MKRILSAAVLAPILWAVVKLASPWAFAILLGLIVALAAWEGAGMLADAGARPFRLLAVLGALGPAASFFLATSTGPELPLVAATVVTVLAALALRDTPRDMLDAILATLFPVLFVGLTLGYAVRLRAIPGKDGPDLLILLFVCVMVGDAAAFYVGTAFGRHRMAPALSPKKSWEGAAGAMVGSAAGALLGHVWFYQSLTLAHTLALGALLGMAGILGDLSESMLKRAAGTKDSSRLIPGHGGMLDRCDSLLFATPLLYYYYVIFLGGRA